LERLSSAAKLAKGIVEDLFQIEIDLRHCENLGRGHLMAHKVGQSTRPARSEKTGEKVRQFFCCRVGAWSSTVLAASS